MNDDVLICQLCGNEICNVIDSNLDEDDEVLLLCPDCLEKIVYGDYNDEMEKLK